MNQETFSIELAEGRGDAQREIIDLVGHTPLIPLNRLSSDLPPDVEIHAKAEWYNPSGSVKDRPAAEIVEQALEVGKLHPGKALLDASSGNMGIAYATIGAAMKIPIRLTIPSNASPERLKILSLLGARTTLTDPLEGTDGAQQIAQEIAAEDPGRYYYADQYSNPANWQAHYKTTGPEVFAQTSGQITHFVSGLGTTGTITGTGLYLRENNPSIELIAVQPDSPLHGLDGLKHLESSHIPAIFVPELITQTIQIPTEDAYEMVSHLANHEGILVGISAAAAVAAALKLGKSLTSGLIVVLLPDSVYKYLNLPVWSEA
jgi:cysteine synthase B